MSNAKHAAESAKKATVKKAALATAVAAATMLTGANAAIAAPAAAQNCAPNKDDVKAQQQKQSALKDLQEEAQKATKLFQDAAAVNDAAQAKVANDSPLNKAQGDTYQSLKEAEGAYQAAHNAFLSLQKKANKLLDDSNAAHDDFQKKSDANDAAQAKVANDSPLNKAQGDLYEKLTKARIANQLAKTAFDNAQAKANKALDDKNAAYDQLKAAKVVATPAVKAAKQAFDQKSAANDAAQAKVANDSPLNKAQGDTYAAWQKAQTAFKKASDDAQAALNDKNAAYDAYTKALQNAGGNEEDPSVKAAKQAFDQKSAANDAAQAKVANDSPLNQAQGDTFAAWQKAQTAFKKASDDAQAALNDKNAAYDKLTAAKEQAKNDVEAGHEDPAVENDAAVKAAKQAFDQKSAANDAAQAKVANDSPLNQALGDTYKSLKEAEGAYHVTHNAFLGLQAKANKALDDKNAAYDKFQKAHKAWEDADAKVANDSPLNKAQGDLYEKLILARTANQLAKTAFDNAQAKANKALDDKNAAYDEQQSANAAVVAAKADLDKFVVREDCVVPNNGKSDVKQAANKVVVKTNAAKAEQGGLAETGANSIAAAITAAVLLGTGAGLAVARRRNN